MEARWDVGVRGVGSHQCLEQMHQGSDIMSAPPRLGLSATRLATLSRWWPLKGTSRRPACACSGNPPSTRHLARARAPPQGIFPDQPCTLSAGSPAVLCCRRGLSYPPDGCSAAQEHNGHIGAEFTGRADPQRLGQSTGSCEPA